MSPGKLEFVDERESLIGLEYKFILRFWDWRKFKMMLVYLDKVCVVIKGVSRYIRD